MEAEPAWKRNGRNGPLDWWLGCRTHGTQWDEHCLSCGIAIDHNIDFKARLERERAAAGGVPTSDRAPSCDHPLMDGGTGGEGQ